MSLHHASLGKLLGKFETWYRSPYRPQTRNWEGSQGKSSNTAGLLGHLPGTRLDL